MTDYFAIPINASREGSWQNVISAQGRLMKEQQQHLGDLLTNTVSQAFLAHPAPVMPPSSLIPCPDKFMGKISQCKGFLQQCSPYIASQVVTRKLQFLNLLTDSQMGHGCLGGKQLLPVKQEQLHAPDYALEFIRSLLDVGLPRSEC